VQLIEEQFDLVFDSIIWIFQKHAYVNDFSFELEHVIQHKMCDYHQSLPSYMALIIMKQSENLIGFFIQMIWESVKEVTD